ncbi:hypothetical protein PI124_g19800 [Phytophthora idaei]|nr:hypothetical protein PI125_g20912 [Phytophthora idaei]KAG3131189.1 hypothetical protein PI126_g20173 [Phytophthora idaei]KAG3235156.1 hypothetical protein PI124_g19800 [Phytophthora idaei]
MQENIGDLRAAMTALQDELKADSLTGIASSDESLGDGREENGKVVFTNIGIWMGLAGKDSLRFMDGFCGIMAGL